MKKNKIMLSVISGLLVAAVAVGGTLAYLSDKSNMVTNTFNVGDGYTTEDGHTGLWLDETTVTTPLAEEPSTENRFDEDNGTQTYPDLLPGTQFAKDPTFHLTAGSVDSYIIAKVTNAQEAKAVGYIFKDAAKTTGFDANWKKVANINGTIIGGDVADDTSLNGYYLFVDDAQAGKIVRGGGSTEAIFTYVQLDSNIANEALAAANNQKTTVIGVAVQATNNTAANAVSEAVNLLK